MTPLEKARQYCEACGYLIDDEESAADTVIAYDRNMNVKRVPVFMFKEAAQ